ncbi:Protein of unknown function, partial [Gryllus bimaculatus]
MPNYRCFGVPNFLNKRVGDAENTRLFTFPTDHQRCMEWLMAITYPTLATHLLTLEKRDHIMWKGASVEVLILLYHVMEILFYILVWGSAMGVRLQSIFLLKSRCVASLVSNCFHLDL